MADTPIQPDNEFSSDMVKAVENIATNVKAGSNDLTRSFDGLSKSIESMKSALSSKLDQVIGSFAKGASGSSGDKMSSREKFEAKQSLIAAKMSASVQTIMAKMNASLQVINARTALDTQKTNLRIQNINAKESADTKKTNLKIEQINTKSIADSLKSEEKIQQINTRSAADTKKSEEKLQQIAEKSAADVQKSNQKLQQIDAKSAADLKKSEAKMSEQTHKSDLKLLEIQTKAQVVQQNAIDRHNNKMQELAIKVANAQTLIDLKSANKQNENDQKHQLKMQEMAQKQADALEKMEIKRISTLEMLERKAQIRREEYDRKKADKDAREAASAARQAEKDRQNNAKPGMPGFVGIPDSLIDAIRKEREDSVKPGMPGFVGVPDKLINEMKNLAKSLKEGQESVDRGDFTGPEMPKDVEDKRKNKVVLNQEQVQKVSDAISKLNKEIPKTFKDVLKYSAKNLAAGGLAGGLAGSKLSFGVSPTITLMGGMFGALTGAIGGFIKSSLDLGKKADLQRDSALELNESLKKQEDGSILFDESIYKKLMEKPQSLMESLGEYLKKFKSSIEESAKVLGEAISFAAEEFIKKFTGFLKPLFGGSLVSGGMKLMGFGPKNKTEHKADGGTIFEPKGTDTVPAMLTPGEFVVNKDATKKNKGLLQAINNGKAKGGSIGYFSSGGGVSYLASGGAAAGGAGAIMAGIGIAMNSITSAVQIATGAVQMFGAALAKANPAMMEQIGIIMNDLQGVIGRALIPVVQMVIPLFRQYADYVDAGMQALQPVIAILVQTFATLFDPMVQLGMTILNIVAPVLTLVGGLLSGFATILDPLIQMVAEAVESIQAFFTAILGPIPFMEILKVGFDALAQVLKMVQGVFSMLIASFQKTIGMLVSGLGAVLSKIPFMGDAGEAMKKAGENLEGQAKNQFDKGMARVGEGASNLGKMIQDPKNYKLDDKTRFKAGEIIGKDKGIKPGSSVGAAVREVQSMSISSIGDDIRKSAMMAGMGQKSQEELLGGIEKNLEKDKLAAAVQQGVMAANNAVQKPVVFNQPPNMNAQNGGVNAVPA